MKRLTMAGIRCILICWSTLALAQGDSAPVTLTMGVVPQFPAVELQRRWGPIAEWLEQQCKAKIALDFAPNIPDFEQRFLRGQLDLAYMNPYHAVMARGAQGYEPLVREGKNTLKGILVARADGPVRQLQDLKGATIAFPAPNAFGASLYMRALLEREHGIPFKPYYAKTHANSYRHVLTGEASAAGGIAATLEAESPEVRAQLRVIYETPDAAPHPLMAHPRVGTDVRRCLTRAMTRPDLPEAIKSSLALAQIPQPVAADYARDYRPLERLALEAYVVRTSP